MKSRQYLVLIIITFIILYSLKARDVESDDAQLTFDVSRLNAMSFNQIAELLQNNKIEDALNMASLRVAYEIGSIRANQGKLSPEDLVKAKELYIDVYPLLKRLERFEKLQNMPKKWKDGLNLYFEEMRKVKTD